MPEKKIRFAVWNLSGPKNVPSETPKKKPQWQQRAEEILFQKTPEADFVFLQEIPNPLRTALKEKDVFKDPAQKKFYDWHSARPDPDYFRGILFFQKNRTSSFHFKRRLEPVGFIGQAYSIYDGPREIFRFVGFWNVRQIPEKDAPENGEKPEQNYLVLLKQFLNRVIPENVPCIIAGDTNVCIRSQDAEDLTPEICAGIRRDLENFLLLKAFCLVDGKNGELDQFTHWFLKKSYFRCDLLMASPCLLPHLTDLSVGEPEIYMKDPGGSDHSPLFFSFVYDA